MGLFAHWVCAKEAADALRDAGFAEVVETEAAGWRMGYPERRAQLPEWEEFDDAVARLAADAGWAALGSWIYDSDVGYLIAADGDGGITRPVVNPEAADAYDLPLPEAWPDGAIAGFAEWSKGAPNSLDSTAIADVVGRDWTFAEEGVQEVHERLGLAAPYQAEPDMTVPTSLPRATIDAIDAGGLGGYEGPLPWMTEASLVGNRLIPWEEARHVPGVGADFISIWDQASPDEPIARFSLSSRGESKARDELDRLREPLLRSEVGGDELAGFVRPLDVLPALRLIMQELPWKAARYVAGHGSDFVGVWDRERPGEPVERFPSDHSGLMQAYDTVASLSFEDALARKALPGLRLYLPRVQPLVQQEVAPDFLDHLQGLIAEDRAAWAENLQRGSWVHTPSGPWLLTEDDEDDVWRPSVGGSGPFYLYGYGFTGVETADELLLVCQGNLSSEDARQSAACRYAQGEWREVPEEAPRNLLETVRWLLADG